MGLTRQLCCLCIVASVPLGLGNDKSGTLESNPQKGGVQREYTQDSERHLEKAQEAASRDTRISPKVSKIHAADSQRQKAEKAVDKEHFVSPKAAAITWEKQQDAIQEMEKQAPPPDALIDNYHTTEAPQMIAPVALPSASTTVAAPQMAAPAVAYTPPLQTAAPVVDDSPKVEMTFGATDNGVTSRDQVEINVKKPENFLQRIKAGEEAFVTNVKKKPAMAVGVGVAALTGLAAAGVAAGEMIHEQGEKKNEEIQKRKEAEKFLHATVAKATKVAGQVRPSSALPAVKAATVALRARSSVAAVPATIATTATTTSTQALIDASSIPSWAWFLISMLPVVFCCCFLAGLSAFLSKRKKAHKVRALSQDLSEDQTPEETRKEQAPLLNAAPSEASSADSLPQLPPLLVQAPHGYAYPSSQAHSRPSTLSSAPSSFAMHLQVQSPSFVPTVGYSVPTGSFHGPPRTGFLQPAPQGHSFAGRVA